MGLFDKLKKKAQEAMQGVVPGPQAPQREVAEEAAPAEAPARPRVSGPSFEWDGDAYPLPQGWSGLSLEDWFLKLEQARDRVMHAEEENLEPMTDADGNRLDAEEVMLIKLGFQNGRHWEAFRAWGVSSWAAKTGESFTDLEFRMGGIAREKIMAQKAGAMRGGGGGGGGALDPVEGVSVEQWAQIQAALAGGGNLDALLARSEHRSAEVGSGQRRVDGAHADGHHRHHRHGLWQRLRRRRAGPVRRPGRAGGRGGVGGNLGGEPIPFERFVEVQEAMGAAADKGQDPTAVLAHFGLSPLDWGNVGMFWNKRIQQEATKYHQLFTQYSNKYRAKYRR